MTSEEKLIKLKNRIDEENYPYFTDEDLAARILLINEDNFDLEFNALTKELLLLKSNIESIKLGDIEIPSPKDHFLMLASGYRKSMSGQTVVRADGR